MSSVLWYSAWHIVGAQKVFVVTSLVVQWLGVCLPMRRSGEIPHVAAQLLKAPVHPRAGALQKEKPPH